MHTKIKIILFTIGISILLSACNKQDQEEITKKAKQVSVDFMKSKESIVFVPEEVEFTSAIGGGTVWVEGYNKKILPKNIPLLLIMTIIIMKLVV